MTLEVVSLDHGPMTAAERAFYTAQSTTSDPGEFAERLDALPTDPRSVVGIVSGLVLHPVFLARRRVDHPHADARDAEARSARELLRRIVERDARPLGVARPYERRVIGTCRHCSGPGTTMPPAAAARLDEIAALTAGPAPDWQALRGTYEAGEDLRVPATVLSFPEGGPIEVPV